MKRWLIIGLMLALLSTNAYAGTNTTCTNYKNSRAYMTIYNASDDSILSTLYEDIYCHFNCSSITGECNTSEPISASLFGIALLIIAALFIIAAVKSSSGFVFRGLNIEFLQPLFFTFSFLMILTSFTIMISGSMSSSSIYSLLGNGYNSTMWVFIFFIGFMVISFIVNLLQNRLNQATRGKH